MARTLTHHIPLGFTAPPFELPDVVSAKLTAFNDVKGEAGTVVVFMCNHCPFVVHILNRFIDVAHEYLPKGIGFVAISSNDVVNYPADHPDKMRELALTMGFPFAYLYDEDQSVARAYDAACTPDFNVFDADDRCVYRGQFDASRPGNDHPVTGADLAAVLDQLLRGAHPSPENQIPSMGCNIKWKSA
jgi:peroxiredoxin